MHYRITKIYHEADKRDELTEILNEKRESLNSFEGLSSVRMVSVSDTATIAVSVYETEEQLKAVEPRFQEVMVDLMPLMTSPPEVHNGDVFWEYDN
ncbi:MAG: hypothetical protein QF780_00050 [Candidatus Marinimicrobia bacterium]|jgi:hypothetical protein|nr:hypothetical protein [Candidatus Neomarinimicrobiota bacterium]|tara:strand:- start:2968 stop:3255 length:288 start_codon:yes stop_codon:yes gene_type:complete